MERYRGERASYGNRRVAGKLDRTGLVVICFLCGAAAHEFPGIIREEAGKIQRVCEHVLRELHLFASAGEKSDCRLNVGGLGELNGGPGRAGGLPVAERENEGRSIFDRRFSGKRRPGHDVLKEGRRIAADGPASDHFSRASADIGVHEGAGELFPAGSPARKHFEGARRLNKFSADVERTVFEELFILGPRERKRKNGRADRMGGTFDEICGKARHRPGFKLLVEHLFDVFLRRGVFVKPISDGNIAENVVREQVRLRRDEHADGVRVENHRQVLVGKIGAGVGSFRVRRNAAAEALDFADGVHALLAIECHDPFLFYSEEFLLEKRPPGFGVVSLMHSVSRFMRQKISQ